MPKRRQVAAEKRSGIITLRLRGENAELIRAAARELDHPVSVFVRSAAVREARKIMSESTKQTAA